MKKRIWGVIIIAVCFLLVVVAIVMPIVLKRQTCQSDILMYIGSIVGAIFGVVGTIIGIFLTVRFSQKQYQEDTRNRVLPYIALTPLRIQNVRTFTEIAKANCKQDNIETGYKEFEVTSIYLILQKDMILYKTKLSEEQMQLVHYGGLINKPDGFGGFALETKQYVHLPIVLKNVGNGAAIEFRIGLNEVNITSKPTYTYPQSLSVGDKFFVTILGEDLQSIYGKEYILEIYYLDIFQHQYCQRYLIKVGEQQDDYLVTIDLAVNQELLPTKQIYNKQTRKK